MNCPLCNRQRTNEWTRVGARLYWLCEECYLIWLDESLRPGADSEKARYLTHQNLLDSPEYISYLRTLAQPVERFLQPGAKGLDFGCGPTEGMKKVFGPNFPVDSYDPFFFPQENLLKNRYDFVLCSEAAEHFFSPAKEFALFKTILNPHGVLGISSRLAVSRDRFASWNYGRDPTHVVFYQKETVEWIAQKFGWQLLELNDPIWIFRA